MGILLTNVSNSVESAHGHRLGCFRLQSIIQSIYAPVTIVSNNSLSRKLWEMFGARWVANHPHSLACHSYTIIIYYYTNCLSVADWRRQEEGQHLLSPPRALRQEGTDKNQLAGSLPSSAFLTCSFSAQPVILKELKQMDGDFNENQRIELNTVRLKTVETWESIQTKLDSKNYIKLVRKGSEVVHKIK